MERDQDRPGQQEWPLASFFTVVEGDQKQRPRRLYLSRKMTDSMPPVSTSLWPVFPFRGRRPATSCPLNSPPKEQRWAGLSAGREGPPGQWVFYLPEKVTCGWLDPLS